MSRWKSTGDKLSQIEKGEIIDVEFVIIMVLALGLYFILEHVNDEKGGTSDPQSFRPNSD